MADIDAAIRSGLDRAWVVLAPRLKTVTYRHVTTGTYQAATGTVPRTVATTTLRCFLLAFEMQQVAGTDVLASDLRAIIRASDLPAADEGDGLTDHRGIDWTVAAVRGDPDFYYDLVLRR